jgi:hypothetical protein
MRAYDYREEIKIAAQLRDELPRGRSLLFHGTTCALSILKHDILVCRPWWGNGSEDFEAVVRAGARRP